MACSFMAFMPQCLHRFLKKTRIRRRNNSEVEGAQSIDWWPFLPGKIPPMSIDGFTDLRSSNFTDTMFPLKTYDWNRDHLTKRPQNLETFRSLGETSQVIFETSSPLLAQRVFFLRWWVFLGVKLDLMEVSISMNFQSQSPFWKNFCVRDTQRGQVVFMGFGCLNFCVFGLMSNSVFEAGWHLGEIKGQFVIWDFYPPTWEAEKLESAPPKSIEWRGFSKDRDEGIPLEGWVWWVSPSFRWSLLWSRDLWPDVLDQTMLCIYNYT